MQYQKQPTNINNIGFYSAMINLIEALIKMSQDIDHMINLNHGLN
jgi:hypothetical protein